MKEGDLLKDMGHLQTFFSCQYWCDCLMQRIQAEDPAGFAGWDLKPSDPLLLGLCGTCQHYNDLCRLSGLLIFLNVTFRFQSHLLPPGAPPIQLCMETHCEKLPHFRDCCNVLWSACGSERWKQEVSLCQTEGMKVEHSVRPIGMQDCNFLRDRIISVCD